MVNYDKAMIYKIVPKDNNDYCYIGSTCDFKSRKNQHKTMCNNPNSRNYNTPIYKHIRDNGGWEEYEMILIEYYPCETKLELHKRERECKIEYNDNLGNSIPCRTKKEYHQDNKERIEEYRQNNIIKITERKKKYRKKNYDKIRNKEKEYYEANKEAIREKAKEKIECQTCKCYIRRDSMKKHTQTKKHIANL